MSLQLQRHKSLWKDLSQDEQAQIELILNQCFRCSSYFENYPQIFHKTSDAMFYLGTLNDKIVTLLSTHFFRWKAKCFDEPGFLQRSTLATEKNQTNDSAKNGVCIGSVATKRDFRNQGFASNIVKYCTEDLRKQGLNFALLFANKSAMYQKLGFKPAAADTLLTFDADWSGRNAKLLLEEMTKIDASKDKVTFTNVITSSIFDGTKTLSEALDFLETRKPHGWPQTPRQTWEELFKIPNMNLGMVKEHSSGKLLALCFMGKGLDFENTIHSFCYQNLEIVPFLLFSSLKCVFENTAYNVHALIQEDIKQIFFGYEFQSSATLFVKALGASRHVEKIIKSNIYVPGVLSC